MIAAHYFCLACQFEWLDRPGAHGHSIHGCPRCGDLYFEWMNYREKEKWLTKSIPASQERRTKQDAETVSRSIRAGHHDSGGHGPSRRRSAVCGLCEAEWAPWDPVSHPLTKDVVWATGYAVGA